VREIVDAHLDRVARHVLARHAAALRKIELLLEIDAEASRCCTAAIASASRRCASRDVFARTSDAMVTNARSGARWTTASPIVTTTLSVSCAAAGAVTRRSAASITLGIRS
jgi:hypothetical protein